MSRPFCSARDSTLVGTFDVAIIGGGPAGSAAAIALARRGLSVALIEKTRYERPRIGETLLPAARVQLAKLDVWERFMRDSHAPSPANIAAWGESDLAENHFIFNPYGNGWHLDRVGFDAMLACAADEAGARVWRGLRVNGWGFEHNRWRIAIEDSGKFCARFLIDATGRAGILSRQMGAKRVEADRLVALVAFFENHSAEAAPLPPGLGMPARFARGASHGAQAANTDNRTLVESVQGGWWYSAFLPDKRGIIAYMTDADLLPSTHADAAEYWLGFLQQTVFTRERVDGSLESLRATPALQGNQCGGSERSNLSIRGLRDCFVAQNAPRHDTLRLQIFSAQSYITNPVVGENWLAVGDAAFAFDPLSSQGIFNALESGLRAAECIAQYFDAAPNALEQYAGWAELRYQKFLLKRNWYYNQERRWMDSEFWKRRQGNEFNDR